MLQHRVDAVELPLPVQRRPARHAAAPLAREIERRAGERQHDQHDLVEPHAGGRVGHPLP
ncbi:hypothetical protein OWS73_36360 [Burkholderia sp. 1B3(2022)]